MARRMYSIINSYKKKKKEINCYKPVSSVVRGKQLILLNLRTRRLERLKRTRIVYKTSDCFCIFCIFMEERACEVESKGESKPSRFSTSGKEQTPYSQWLYSILHPSPQQPNRNHKCTDSRKDSFTPFCSHPLHPFSSMQKKHNYSPAITAVPPPKAPSNPSLPSSASSSASLSLSSSSSSTNLLKTPLSKRSNTNLQAGNLYL
jgi:hypothetical protein